MPRGRPRKKYDDALFKSAEMIGWAIGGLEREIVQTRERLNALTAQVAKLRAGAGIRGLAKRTAAAAAPAGEAAAPGRRRRRRKMSAEARRRISERMKKTWAERRKAKA